MKIRIVSVLGVCALATCLASPAAAEENNAPQGTTTMKSAQQENNPNATPVINKRQRHQKARIKRGVKSGELTKHETRRLVKEQKAIRKEEREAKADGTLTKEERKEIRKDERRASRDIFRQKHDAQKRPRARR